MLIVQKAELSRSVCTFLRPCKQEGRNQMVPAAFLFALIRYDVFFMMPSSASENTVLKDRAEFSSITCSCGRNTGSAPHR